MTIDQRGERQQVGPQLAPPGRDLGMLLARCAWPGRSGVAGGALVVFVVMDPGS